MILKFGLQNCPVNGHGNLVPQFFHMFGDTVYAYHDLLPEIMMIRVYQLAHNRL